MLLLTYLSLTSLAFCAPPSRCVLAQPPPYRPMPLPLHQPRSVTRLRAAAPTTETAETRCTLHAGACWLRARPPAPVCPAPIRALTPLTRSKSPYPLTEPSRENASLARPAVPLYARQPPCQSTYPPQHSTIQRALGAPRLASPYYSVWLDSVALPALLYPLNDTPRGREACRPRPCASPRGFGSSTRIIARNLADTRRRFDGLDGKSPSSSSL